MERMLQIVNETIPKDQIHSVENNSMGWDNDILIINEEMVFRFPKTRKIASKVVDEVVLLKQLAAKKPLLEFPQYEPIHMDGELAGVKYPYLKGKPLGESSPSAAQSAELLGDFLTKLHSIRKSDLPNLQTNHTEEYWNELFLSVQTFVFPHLIPQHRTKVQDFFEEYLIDYEKESINLGVIHGDLTTANILYKPEAGVVSGIIDFTDAQWGDPAFDFAGLYWSYGPCVTKEVLSHYREEGKEAIFKRVQDFYGLQPIFHQLVYAVKESRHVNWEQTLDRFLYLYELRGRY
ncbi:aminoglycoside phosphotransferase family protein [Bacillus sp. AFS015802]|uniref:aminoglycoside phosphotransferase family protein n=1 Tax=Bacillus sp. AFS015802 TaxID=2033486 RepID=UPI00211D27E5|nr:aminoglycoside phosphotransferase family protein [Bacillus sp. AFS015802]